MQTIKIQKDWGDYEAGTEFVVLGSHVRLERDGTATYSDGRKCHRPVVDEGRAQQLKSDGYLRKPRKKKRSKKGGSK